MAGIAYVYKRLWNPEILIDDNSVIPHKCRRMFHGRYPMMYEIKWTGGTQAGEELGTAGTLLKNGTVTPFQVTVVSSSADDKRTTAAGAVHSVALIGVSVASITDYTNGIEKPKTSVEVVSMNGTADVLSQRFYLWVDHIYACEWGTAATHDATGIITAESPANTNLLVLAATFNEGEGGTWHWRKDCGIETHLVSIKPTAALAGGDGVALTAAHTGYDHTLQDENIIEKTDYYTYIHYGGEPPFEHNGDDNFRYASTLLAKCVWSEALIANTQTIQIKIFQKCSPKPYKL